MPRGLTSIASRRVLLLLLLAVPLLLVCATPTAAAGFELEETTIAQIHESFESGELTCRELTQRYLDRIEAYDEQGPEINSIINVHPDVLAAADELDEQFRASGLSGPLHCVPTILKDNYDTADMPTTAGSLVLEHSIPPDDAHIVSLLRDAGALILAKANLDEWASGGIAYSSLGGFTRNPYDLDRSPGGSSAGSGAAVAANLGAVAMGTDTGGSIREPAAHVNIVGIRPTQGLVSRDGLIPLSDTQDTAGPMTRTVEDAARVLDVIAGYDPADDQTSRGVGRIPAGGYAAGLDADALIGARIGVLRAPDQVEAGDSGITAVFDRAVVDLERLGATAVELTDLPPELLDKAEVASVGNDFEAKRELNRYFESLGPDAPVSSLEEVIESGLYIDPPGGDAIGSEREYQKIDVEGLPSNVEYLQYLAARTEAQDLVLQLMADHDLDAIVFPVVIHLQALLGGEAEGADARNISPATGFPEITVPAGFTKAEQLPVGMDFLGRPFSEAQLLDYAYAYEQGTQHRRAPEATPALR